MRDKLTEIYRKVFSICFLYFLLIEKIGVFLMNENLKAALKLSEQHNNNVKQNMNHWLNHELFSWNWWLLVALTVIPLIIWIMVVDRKRLLEILLFGTLIIILTSYLDAAGFDLMFWVYPVEFMPLTTIAIPFNVSMVSVTYMMMYQFFNSWKSYSIALISMAIIFAFIGEPVSKLLNWIHYIHWNYYYSFLYYIVIGILVKVIVNKCKDIYIKV